MKYMVVRMTTKDYSNVMKGSFDYDLLHIIVDADSKEDAIKKASEVGYVVIVNNVRPVAEM